MENEYNPYTREMMDEWHVELTRHVTDIVRKCSEYFLKNGYDSISVIDVGSNTGRFLELLDEKICVSDAILIDAIDELVEYSKNILHRKNYSYESVGLSNENTTSSIYFSQITEGIQPNLGTAKLHPDGHRDIRIQTFDSLWEDKFMFIEPKPDLIKIDAEGYDIKAIQGMQRFITQLDKKPMIVYELAGLNLGKDEQDEIHENLQFLTDMGYKPYWHNSLTPQFSCDVALTCD